MSLWLDSFFNVFILLIMKKIVFGVLALSVATVSCVKDDCVLNEEKEGLVTPRLES